jgi:tetratricopeptide (TPR) repeat protein
MYLVALAVLLAQPPQDPAYTALNRAYEQLRLKQYDDAVASFRRVLELDPTRIAIHKEIAYTLQKMGETEQAVEAFEAYHRALPSDYTTIMELAYLYAQVQKEDRALEFFKMAAQSSDPAQAAQARQGFQNVEGPIMAEITRWRAATAQDAQNFDARESLADAYVMHGEAAAAIEQYAWLRREAPTRYRHLITLAELHGKLGASHADAARAYALLAMRAPDPRVTAQGRALFGERYPYLYELQMALELEPWQTEIRKEVNFITKKEEPVTAPTPATAADDPVRRHRELGYASLAKSFLDDAVREFTEVHRLDPSDDQAVLQLALLYNMLKKDQIALGWFKLARASRDRKVAEQARQAIHNLEPSRVTTTVWALPLVSSRFNTAFGYGQIKSELNLKGLSVKPYISFRFEGDTRSRTGGTNPLVLSADGGIAAVGLIGRITPHTWAWGEAGNALSAVARPSQPDYRGGLAYARTWGARLFSDASGKFFDTNTDAVYFSRLNRDAILYTQTKTGYQFPGWHRWHHQAFFMANVVTDRNRDVYNNFVEMGPAYRFGHTRFAHVWAYAAWLRGVYMLPGKASYNDLRLVIWWAKTF